MTPILSKDCGRLAVEPSGAGLKELPPGFLISFIDDQDEVEDDSELLGIEQMGQ